MSIQNLHQNVCRPNDINSYVSLHLLCFYFNPFKPEFTILIFIHYKPRIAAAILDL